MEAGSTAIVGVTALVGDRLEVVHDCVVLIAGSNIVAVGNEEEITIPEDATIFDATGLTLVPGFIDAHVHIGFYRPADVLAGGVTTVRDLGWPPDEIFALAARSRADGFEGPLILAAGPILTAPGGYPTRAAWAPRGTGREVHDAQEGRAAVCELLDAGAVVIKVALNPPVGPTLPLEALTAMVDEAHERGAKVTGHVHDIAELGKALTAGMDELAHVPLSGEAIPDATIERMVAAGMTLVPTLAIFSGASLRRAVDNVARFVAAGGRVVYGTDLGNAGPQPGIDRLEVAAMSQAAMSPHQIVRAATVDAAEHLGLDRKGAIAVGHDADLVALAGDPLRDASDLTRVRHVWREGRATES